MFCWGVMLSAVYGGLADGFAEILDGVASLTATFVLTYMILWMTQHAQTLRADLEGKLDDYKWRASAGNSRSISCSGPQRDP